MQQHFPSVPRGGIGLAASRVDKREPQMLPPIGLAAGTIDTTVNLTRLTHSAHFAHLGGFGILSPCVRRPRSVSCRKYGNTYCTGWQIACLAGAMPVANLAPIPLCAPPHALLSLPSDYQRYSAASTYLAFTHLSVDSNRLCPRRYSPLLAAAMDGCHAPTLPHCWRLGC